MTTGRNILCFSSIDWEFNWQGHQEVMAALAEQGNRVLFIENTGVRVPRLSDYPRLKRRVLNWWKGTKGFRQERRNLYVYSPVVLPFPHSRFARWINRALLSAALQRWCRAAHFGRPIVWTFLPTALVVDLLDRLDPALVVYYCIADFAQLTTNPRALARSERKLLDRADVVFAQGEELRQRCLPHPNVHIFPFGVNLSVFRREVPAAPELDGLKRPIVGYVGGLHRHVDMELLDRLASRIEGTLVAVGPTQTHTNGLEARPNVFFAGPQPHSRVPEFVKGFDVAVIPYALTNYTRTVYPTKMNEYLAMGVPVVTTDLPEVRKFAESYGDVVHVTSTHQAFVTAVQQAAGERSAEDEERRVAAARANSWAYRIVEMTALMDAARERREQREELWDAALLRLYRNARRRTIPAATAILAIYLVLFQSPALWVIASPLLVTAPPEPADAIVVLGGGVGESGVVASGSYEERVRRAVDLYQDKLARTIVFSSAYSYLFNEAEVMKALATNQGIPASDILVETRAGSTRDNVLRVRDIAEREGWRRVLLVSSPYHMRRAVLTWEKLAPNVAVISTPVVQSRFYAHGLGASASQIRGIAHEYAAIAYYWMNGWI
jgi:uncharacterized SAM-binding protein YcdF (DUF218 family)/glycosyltransferase involved in cell wall biosynthesis